ncbi:MAG: STAS domain-containing protein [Coraliomargarita sp.]
MSDPKQPTFLVSAYSDPIVVQIHGKANYLNCSNFREFMEKMVADGKTRFVLDFERCKGMDSTFLGILAGTALELRKQEPAGKLCICKLSQRNNELIVNLGLQALLEIEEAGEGSHDSADFSSLENKEVSSAASVLDAHENLVKADEQNASKFQDVIAFLKNQVETEGDS